ncbi:hypothetical protein BH11PSE2_BH11PSE2_18020 [soil metagenome]
MSQAGRREYWFTTKSDRIMISMFWPIHWKGWLSAAMFFASLIAVWSGLVIDLTDLQVKIATGVIVAAFCAVCYWRCDW